MRRKIPPELLTRLFYNDRMNKRARIGEQEGL